MWETFRKKRTSQSTKTSMIPRKKTTTDSERAGLTVLKHGQSGDLDVCLWRKQGVKEGADSAREKKHTRFCIKQCPSEAGKAQRSKISTQAARTTSLHSVEH